MSARRAVLYLAAMAAALAWIALAASWPIWGR